MPRKTKELEPKFSLEQKSFTIKKMVELDKTETRIEDSNIVLTETRYEVELEPIEDKETDSEKPQKPTL